MMRPTWLAAPPPDAAVEITADRVSAATLATRGGGRLVVQSHASESLPPGAVVPSLTAQNVVNPAPVTQALRVVLERLNSRARRVALVIPDVAARVSLLRFEQVPARREDLDQLVRWQLKKSAPFAVEDACVTYSPGARTADGAEFVTVLARREVVREYEAVCEAVGVHPGLVDLATLSLVNLYAGAATAPRGDWLVVHIRPEYTSLAIMRGDDVIFFRNRLEGDETSLPDLVHQTAMYYQDRLDGRGFSRVLLGGAGHLAEAARRSLEERLVTTVEPIDPTQAAALTDRVSGSADLADVLSPLVGVLVRSREEAAVRR